MAYRPDHTGVFLGSPASLREETRRPELTGHLECAPTGALGGSPAHLVDGAVCHQQRRACRAVPGAPPPSPLPSSPKVRSRAEARQDHAQQGCPDWLAFLRPRGCEGLARPMGPGPRRSFPFLQGGGESRDSSGAALRRCRPASDGRCDRDATAPRTATAPERSEQAVKHERVNGGPRTRAIASEKRQENHHEREGVAMMDGTNRVKVRGGDRWQSAGATLAC
jgi:hypothetical protein